MRTGQCLQRCWGQVRQKQSKKVPDPFPCDGSARYEQIWSPHRDFTLGTGELWWTEGWSLKHVYVLIPRTCEYVTLQSKRDFADVIKSRILICGDESGLSRWAHGITKGPYRGRRESQILEDVTQKQMSKRRQYATLLALKIEEEATS